MSTWRVRRLAPFRLTNPEAAQQSIVPSEHLHILLHWCLVAVLSRELHQPMPADSDIFNPCRLGARRRSWCTGCSSRWTYWTDCAACSCAIVGTVSWLHPPSIFWNSFRETKKTPFSQMMYAAMSSHSLAIVKLATAKLKMKTMQAGLLTRLCSTAIQSCDRQSNRSLLLLRNADLVVGAVDVVDASIPEIVAVPTCEHLAFQESKRFWGPSCTQTKNPSLAFCNRSQNENLYSHVFQGRFDRIIWLPSRQYCAYPMTFGNLLVQTKLRESLDVRRALTALLSWAYPSPWRTWSVVQIGRAVVLDCSSSKWKTRME